MPIQRALISVFDKTGLIPFAKTLADREIEIISTGGTARALKEAGIATVELSDYTGFPEMLDGRVKTLHPKVHGGLLYVRGKAEHESAVEHHNIGAIDLVVVNLYPFEETVAREGVTRSEAIENIDIGGPSMLRSAAKNHESVTVVTDPDDYDSIAEEIRSNGDTTLAQRRQLALKVYQRTSEYDAAIAEYLAEQEEASTESADQPQPPARLTILAPKAQTLRYGENPHQSAALYGKFFDYFDQLHGKALSYNNILDLTAAAQLIQEFQGDEPTLAILKHTNPCGVGQGASLKSAWDKAFATDNQAPFGGIIAVNQILDGPCAEAIREIFSEVIIAPEFSSEALEILTKKKNLRLLQVKKPMSNGSRWESRSVGADSYLAQRRDDPTSVEGVEVFESVTSRQPTDDESRAMRFGWKIVKHLKSNAIVYVGADRTLGVGAGQMSRVDSSRIAVWKAKEAGLSLKGSVVCSDAFFPFPDGLITAAEAGATAAIQPGGSVRDPEVIQAANERNVSMVFTRARHFRH